MPRALPAVVSLRLSAVAPATVDGYRRAYESFRVFVLQYFDTVLTPSLDPLLLDQLCFVSALKKMPHTIVPPVEVTRVTTVQVLHAC